MSAVRFIAATMWLAALPWAYAIEPVLPSGPTYSFVPPVSPPSSPLLTTVATNAPIIGGNTSPWTNALLVRPTTTVHTSLVTPSLSPTTSLATEPSQLLLVPAMGDQSPTMSSVGSATWQPLVSPGAGSVSPSAWRTPNRVPPWSNPTLYHGYSRP